MSEINGVPTRAADVPLDLEAQQPLPGHPPSPSAAPTRQSAHPLNTALAPRGTHVGSTSTEAGASGIRRTAIPQLSTAMSATRRHSLPTVTGPRTEGQMDREVRQAADTFAAFIEAGAPVDSADPTTNLQQRSRRLTVAAQLAQAAFGSVAQTSTSGSDRIVVLPEVPDTPEIRGARTDLEAKTSLVERLGEDAKSKQQRAETLGQVAQQAGAAARSAAEQATEAQREAQYRDAKAGDAEREASRAADIASNKDADATRMEGQATAAEQDAAGQAGAARDAQHLAADAQSEAARKAEDASDAERRATDADQSASAKQGDADGLWTEAKALRAQADRLSEVAEHAPAQEKASAQAAAKAAGDRATGAEETAKEAQAAADAAASGAKHLNETAHALRGQAKALQASADEAKAKARAASESADGAQQRATKLRHQATDLRKEADGQKAKASELAQRAAPLRTAANQANEAAAAARTKQTNAEREASKAAETANRAQEEAERAQRAAQAARGEAEQAARALQELIARTPVPNPDEVQSDPADVPETDDAPARTESRRSDPSHATGATEPAHAAEGAEANEADEAPNVDEQQSTLAIWARNVAKVHGQQFLAVAVSTALREAVGAGVEGLLTHTEASDQAKAGIAGGLYGTLILSNMMTMLYHEREGTGNVVTHAGNIAQIVSLSAGLTAAATTDSLKSLVPSLVKILPYSGHRDVVNLFMPLGDNVPEGKVSPLRVQAVNSLFYACNQMLVNSIQSFHGLSGAGLVDAMQQNSTDPNTQEAQTLGSGLASLAVYVVGNYAGEVGDQFASRMLNMAMSGGNLADLKVTLQPPAWPGAEKAWDTFAADGVSRTSLFYSVYGLTGAANPKISAPHLGETGAAWMQNLVGGALIALLCVPALMTALTKSRRPSGSDRSEALAEQGEAAFTELTTPVQPESTQGGATFPMTDLPRADRSAGDAPGNARSR